MKDCLVTTLKKSANNSGLEYLGGIKVHFNGNTLEKRTLTLAGTVETAIIIEDGGNTHFTSLDGTSDFGKEATVENGGIIIYGTNKILVLSGTAECDVVVSSKYGITIFNTNTNSVVADGLGYVGETSETGASLWLYYNTRGGALDLGEKYFKDSKIHELNIFGTISTNQITAIPYIQDTSHLITLNLQGQRIPKDVYEQICNITTLTSITIGNSRAIDDVDVSKLANLTNLTTISILDIITDFGPIETFVARQRGKGRTTCSAISWKYAGYINATFNGTAVAKDTTVRTLSWTASTITFNGTEISNSDVITE